MLIDEEDRVAVAKRLRNDLALMPAELARYRKRIAGLAVVSYAPGQPRAVKPHEGLKHTDNRHDAPWLAHLLRLGILSEGYARCVDSQRLSNGSPFFFRTGPLFSETAPLQS